MQVSSWIVLFCFVCYVASQSTIEWKAYITNNKDESVVNHGNFFGFYGTKNQLHLFQSSTEELHDYVSVTNIQMNTDEVIVIVFPQSEESFKSPIKTKKINENSSVKNIPIPDNEIIILKTKYEQTNQKTIQKTIKELINQGALPNLDISLLMDHYTWKIPKQYEKIQSQFAYERIQMISNELQSKLINKTDPIVPLLKQVSTERQRAFLDGLTSVHTRLSTAGPVTLQASYFLYGILQGFGLNPFMYYYNSSFPPNVCADIRGVLEPEKLVIVGAHYDDRAADITNTTVRAPGANDDGSGCSTIQEVARILAQSEYSFRYTTRFCFWSGEEQGLYGSEAYASTLKANDTTVLAMLQADMVAYLTPGNPYQVDMAIVETNLQLTDLVNLITSIYVPELKIGTTTSCCTDSASFTEQGYPAVAYNEPGGYTIDPQYHSTLDIVDRPGYSLQLINYITQAIISSTVILAEVI